MLVWRGWGIIGFNYRMTNLVSAIGTAQLGRISDTLDSRAEFVQVDLGDLEATRA